jgi:antitoxin HigA-1
MERNGMRPVHPGEILREDMLPELGMSANALAKALDVPANRITAILNGTRGITADTALRLARYLGTSPEIWLNLQTAYDLRVAELEAGETILRTVQPRAA